MNPHKVVILGTGGTIAGRAARACDHLDYQAAEVSIDDLLAALPQLAAGGAIDAEQVAQIDSKDMDGAIWAELARRVQHHAAQPDVQAVVITHGTDTLEETAYFLHAVYTTDKPVVLTCAMRPASALVPDGPQNILDAVAVARHPGATGVLVVCAGKVHGAQAVQKVHPYRLDAFDSGEASAVAVVEEGRVRMLSNWPQSHVQYAQAAIKKIATIDALKEVADWPWVEIVLSHAGATGAGVRALVAQGVQGVVVAGTGNGSVHHALEAALFEAEQAGVLVVRATRCAQGRVLATASDRFADSQGLSPVKARIALLLRLLAAA